MGRKSNLVKEMEHKRAVRRACIRRYQDKTIRQIAFSLNKEKDADVIAWLDAQENKTDFLRKLVRRDIAANDDLS